jgi:hypothetical protein
MLRKKLKTLLLPGKVQIVEAGKIGKLTVEITVSGLLSNLSGGRCQNVFVMRVTQILAASRQATSGEDIVSWCLLGE